MRILVTGGAGFIGSNYVRQLLTGIYPAMADADVVVLDKVTYAGNEENLTPVASNPRLHFFQGDICDAVLVTDLMADVDLVVHFAAESHVDRSIIGSADFVLTNVLGTHTLLQAALGAGVEKFVHVSTDEVYGSIDSGQWQEDDLLEPNSPYSASKASSDLMAGVLPHSRPAGLRHQMLEQLWPYQFPEKAIPLFITNLLDGGRVPLYGDGMNVRDWLHVDDHCRGIQLVVERGQPGKIYNVGGGTELTNRALTARLLEAVGGTWEQVDMVPDRKGHDRRYSVDIAKIQDELGYEPSVPYDTGLAATVRWYAENRSWWEPLKSRAALAKA